MPEVWQPDRCRYNQISGGRDQQTTDWTRKHQKTTKGEGEGGGTWRERAKPQAPKPQGQTTTRRQPHQDNPNSSNEREKHRSTRKRKQHGKRTGKGQPKQGHPRQARDARPRGTDPNTPPYKTNRQMSLEGMSIPVYTADRRTYTQCLSES